VSRLGRAVHAASFEGQRWWRLGGPVRGAAAAFVDTARTSRRFAGASLNEIDAGIGARFTAFGMPGTLRIDLARGINERATALSFVYVVE
jgi:hypothetical protein